MKELDWADYIVNSLEVEADTRAIAGSEPVDPDVRITPRLRRHYFQNNLYPYEHRLDIRQYFHDKHMLQIELVKLQNWVKDTGERVVVLFEGRDASGKGGTIKRFMEHLNPRVARVVALSKPSEQEQGQWYFQRYIDHLPTAGEIVFFDRSWYNRAGVERVMGFCSNEEYDEFVYQAPLFESMLVRSGLRIIKFYLSVSREEQQHRFEERATNPLKTWKLSPIDQEAQARWDAYTEAKELTFAETDTDFAPWIIVKSEDLLRARIASMRHVLTQFEYTHKDALAVGEPDPLILCPFSVLKSFSDD